MRRVTKLPTSAQKTIQAMTHQKMYEYSTRHLAYSGFVL